MDKLRELFPLKIGEYTLDEVLSEIPSKEHFLYVHGEETSVLVNNPDFWNTYQQQQKKILERITATISKDGKVIGRFRIHDSDLFISVPEVVEPLVELVQRYIPLIRAYPTSDDKESIDSLLKMGFVSQGIVFLPAWSVDKALNEKTRLILKDGLGRLVVKEGIVGSFRHLYTYSKDPEI